MKEVFRTRIILYECGLDPSHPCWGGKQNGSGVCGREIIYVIKREEDKFVVYSQYHEYNTHSVYMDDHVHHYGEIVRDREFDTLEEAKEYIEEIRELREYKPEEYIL